MTEIVPAAPHEYDEALTLLFNQLPPSEQKTAIADVLTALRRGRIANHGVLAAKSDGRMVGSILYLMQQDQTAFVWPPAAAAARVPATDDALLGEVVRRIDAANAWLGQCLLEIDRHTERAILDRNGFRHLTDLRFLVRRLEHFPSALPITGPDGELLETVTYQPGVNDARFAAIDRANLRQDCAIAPSSRGRGRANRRSSAIRCRANSTRALEALPLARAGRRRAVDERPSRAILVGSRLSGSRTRLPRPRSRPTDV